MENEKIRKDVIDLYEKLNIKVELDEKSDMNNSNYNFTMPTAYKQTKIILGNTSR